MLYTICSPCPYICLPLVLYLPQLFVPILVSVTHVCPTRYGCILFTALCQSMFLSLSLSLYIVSPHVSHLCLVSHPAISPCPVVCHPSISPVCCSAFCPVACILYPEASAGHSFSVPMFCFWPLLDTDFCSKFLFEPSELHFRNALHFLCL